MSDSVNSESEHVCAKYRRDLHIAISEFSREIRGVAKQVATAHKAGQLKEVDNLQINGKLVTRDDMDWAIDILMNSLQMPDVVKNLFEKTDSEIKKTIEEVEDFLKKIQNRIKGIKIPKRPPEVDEWMRKIE